MKRLLHPVLCSYLIISVACLIFITTGCSKRESEEIKIGATLPLSGDAAVWGNNTKEGIELALQELNNQGGVLGKNVRVVYEDTEALPEKGVSAFRKLTQIDKVSAIIDDSVSSVTLAMAPLAQTHHVVILATGATAPSISEAGEYVFRIWNSDAYEGAVAAEHASGELKLQRIAILYINNDYGRGLEEVFKGEFGSLGGKIVASESFDQNATDMRTQLAKIKAANPEGLYLVGYPKEAPIALRQARETGLKVQVVGTVAMHDKTLIATAGEAAEGLVFPYPRDPSGEHIERFQKSFRERYSKEPGITADVGYDAIKMISRAIELAGGSTGEHVRTGLNMLKDYPGVSGVMTFDKNGDVHKPMGTMRVKKHDFEWVE